MIKTSVQRKLSSNSNAVFSSSKRKKRVLSSNDNNSQSNKSPKQNLGSKTLTPLVKPEDVSKISKPPTIVKSRIKKTRKSDFLDIKKQFNNKYKSISKKNMKSIKPYNDLKTENLNLGTVKSLQNNKIPLNTLKMVKQSSFQDEMLREVEMRRGNSVLRGKRANFKKKNDLGSIMRVGSENSKRGSNPNSLRKVDRKRSKIIKVRIIIFYF